ncbi:MAG: MarR family winged helix-turn-helix transcriptional regulator [Pseudomonadota bacterium]
MARFMQMRTFRVNDDFEKKQTKSSRRSKQSLRALGITPPADTQRVPTQTANVTVSRRFSYVFRFIAACLWTTFPTSTIETYETQGTEEFLFFPAQERLSGKSLAGNLYLLYLQQMTSSLNDIDFVEMGKACFGHAARRTANLLTRHYNRHLSSLGLELTQAQLLAVIADGSASSTSEIARYLGIERSTLARNLKPLEVAGLISRQQKGSRKGLPVLTPAGQEKVIEIHRTWKKAQEELSTLLGSEEAVAVRAHMSALRKAVHILEDRETSANPAPSEKQV